MNNDETAKAPTPGPHFYTGVTILVIGFLLHPHVIFAFITFYAPEWIPGYDEHRITMNLTADFLLVITLFVLGKTSGKRSAPCSSMMQKPVFQKKYEAAVGYPKFERIYSPAWQIVSSNPAALCYYIRL